MIDTPEIKQSINDIAYIIQKTLYKTCSCLKLTCASDFNDINYVCKVCNGLNPFVTGILSDKKNLYGISEYILRIILMNEESIFNINVLSEIFERILKLRALSIQEKLDVGDESLLLSHWNKDKDNKYYEDKERSIEALSRDMHDDLRLT